MKFFLISLVILSVILTFSDCHYKPHTDEGSAQRKSKKSEDYSGNADGSESEEIEDVEGSDEIKGNG